MIDKLGILLLKKLHELLGNKGLWKLPFVPQIYEIYYQLVSNKGYKTIYLNGINFTVLANDSGISKHLLMYGKYEEVELDIFKSKIQENDIIVDAGANLGLYTVTAADALKNTGEVHAFEPEPINFEVLKKNIEQNNFKNVTLNKTALTDYVGSTKLFVNKYLKGSHSLIKRNVPNVEEYIKVNTTTLDSYYKTNKIKYISILKIDIQGSEPKLLKGAKTLLKNRKIKQIFIEHFAKGLPKNFNLVKYLETFGFKIFIIDTASKKLVKVKFNDFDRNRDCDLYCTLQ